MFSRSQAFLEVEAKVMKGGSERECQSKKGKEELVLLQPRCMNQVLQPKNAPHYFEITTNISHMNKKSNLMMGTLVVINQLRDCKLGKTMQKTA